MKIITQESSKIEEGSNKFGFMLDDGCVIESAFFPKDDYTICLSTQVGCSMKCSFCESGKNGFVRNLSYQELIDQYDLLNNEIVDKYRKEGAAYIVLMGMGEPLLNYDNVVKFINKIKEDKNKQVALCSVGIPAQIYRMINDSVDVKLSISLHATSKEQRRKIMAIASEYDFDELLESIYYFERNQISKSPVDIQYLLFDNLNDSVSDANNIVKYFGKHNFRIILKSVCPIDGQKFFESSSENVKKFIDVLEKNNVNYYYSVSRARDINAGCGQLRSKIINQ